MSIKKSLSADRGEHDVDAARERRLAAPGGDCLFWVGPGNSTVAYLVIWSTGSDDMGLIQSTRASKHLACEVHGNERGGAGGVDGRKEDSHTRLKEHPFD